MEKLGQTTLREIDLAWRAKELDYYLHTRPFIEMDMLQVSSRALGEAERLEKKRYAEDDSKRVQDEVDEAEGEPKKALMFEQRLYAAMPEHLKAMHVKLYGLPGNKEQRKVKPLIGVDKALAGTIMRKIKAKTFTYGPWVNHRLHKQLGEDDRLARERLEVTAKGVKDDDEG